MDRITKALKKLTEKERSAVREILESIAQKDTKALDVKKLKGREDIFRVRKGSIRVIYQCTKLGRISILAIERRSEKTYKRF